MTSLASLNLALLAYRKRFDLEEMFRYFKGGGYNLEATKVTQERLLTLILLITIAESLEKFEFSNLQSLLLTSFSLLPDASSNIEL